MTLQGNGNTSYDIINHAAAGVLIVKPDERVYVASKEFDYMQGWHMSFVQEYCEKKGWYLK